MRVSVIGGSRVDAETAATAAELGRILGENGHTVVCGGLDGVMRAVCRGAREADAETVGILPTADPDDANEFVTTSVATGMGHARNALVVMNGAATIAVDGGPGTLSEIGLALAQNRPVAGIDSIVGSDTIPEIESVDSPAAAVSYVERVADGE